MFQALLERMLTKDPAQRLPNCQTLLAELAQIDPSDLDATQIRPSQPVLSTALPGKPLAASPAAPSGNRWRVLTWLLASLLLAAILGGGGIYYQQQMEIRDLLDLAQQRLDQGQLTEPAQDSAEHFFHQVLQRDSDHSEALAGLQRIRDLQVNGLLEKASERIAERRLLLPEADSAVFYYREVLNLAPDNAQALAGLEAVTQTYRELARTRYSKGELEAALKMVRRGLQVKPDDPELLAMEADHEQKVASGRGSGSTSAGNARRSKRRLLPAVKRLSRKRQRRNVLRRRDRRVFLSAG